MVTALPLIFAAEADGVLVPTPAELLRRSIAGERLAHAYLFVGEDAELLDEAALDLAQVLDCTSPLERAPNGRSLVACRTCKVCRRILSGNHPDVLWVRPQNRTRTIGVPQARDVIHRVEMKPTEAGYKIAVFASADRLNVQAANALLKTLEEPPPGSLLLLLSTEPDRLIETILSRCQRLNFGTGGRLRLSPAATAWLRDFATQAARSGTGLLPRYHLLATLLTALVAMREEIETALKALSPLEKYPDALPEQKECWEDELLAGIEAEYRKRRAEYLVGLQAWLRDVWLESLGVAEGLLNFPDLGEGTATVGRRLKPAAAAGNLESWERTQRLLFTNVQESLTLEVGLIKLQL